MLRGQTAGIEYLIVYLIVVPALLAFLELTRGGLRALLQVAAASAACRGQLSEELPPASDRWRAASTPQQDDITLVVVDVL